MVTLTSVSTELATYKLDLVGVQEIRWDKRGNHKSRELYLFLWKRKQKSSIGNRIFVHHGRVSPVKKVEFVSDMMTYAVLKRSLV